MISHALRWATLGSLLCLAGCGFVADEVLDGPYRLVAVDIRADMSLCRSIGADGSCSGDGPPDRSVTEFYYILRQADERNALKPVSVMGPFSELEYQQEKRRLQLPEFSKVFADLK